MALNPKEIHGQPAPVAPAAAPSSAQAKKEQERMTMQARIEAFYRQSGGPHNPQIQKILERHLLYAKDHGPPGKRETIEDAFIDTVIKDPSNLVILKWIQQARLNRQRQVGSGPEHVQRLERELQSLRKEVAELKQLVQELSKRACALHDSE